MPRKPVMTLRKGTSKTGASATPSGGDPGAGPSRIGTETTPTAAAGSEIEAGDKRASSGPTGQTPERKRGRLGEAMRFVARRISGRSVASGSTPRSVPSTPSDRVSEQELARLKASLAEKEEQIAELRKKIRALTGVRASRSPVVKNIIDDRKTRVQTCDRIKTLLHEEVKRVVAEQDELDGRQQFVDAVDVPNEVKKINPALWDIICTLHKVALEPIHCQRFKSKEENKNVDNHMFLTRGIGGVSEGKAHANIVERYTAYLQMLYQASGGRCRTQLHAQHAALLRYSASTQVHVMGNRFGLAVSRRTLDRMLDDAQLTQDRWKETLSGVKEEIITSYDNLDFEAARRTKHVGKTSSGIHITTIQTSRPLRGVESKDKPEDANNKWKPLEDGSFEEDDFKVNDRERKAREIFDDVIFESNLLRVGQSMCEGSTGTDTHVFQRFPDTLRQGIAENPTIVNVTTQSDILRTSALDVNPDVEDNVPYILDTIAEDNLVGSRSKHHVIAGDQRTIMHVTNTIAKHPKQYDWVVPMMGDFHAMDNFHPCIMNQFWHLGLGQLANGNMQGNESGGMGWTASNADARLRQGKGRSYRDRHVFLRQTSEAVMQEAIQIFLDDSVRKSTLRVSLVVDGNSVKLEMGGFDDEVAVIREELITRVRDRMREATARSQQSAANRASMSAEIDGEESAGRVVGDGVVLLDDMIGTANNWLPPRMDVGDLRRKFETWCDEMGQMDTTFGAWIAYARMVNRTHVLLYTANQIRNWDLRLAAIKEMWVYSRAHNRLWYQRLFPEQLAIYARLPPPIRELFEEGGFAINLDRSECGGEAPDELHESYVNLRLSLALPHATIEQIQREAPRLALIATALANLNESFAPSHGRATADTAVVAASLKHQMNVNEARRLLRKYGALRSAEEGRDVRRGLVNVFIDGGRHKASANQIQGTIDAYALGKRYTEQHVQNWYLSPGVAGRVLRTKPKFERVPLVTMGPPPSAPRRGTAIEQKLARQQNYFREFHGMVSYCQKKGVQMDPQYLYGQVDDLPVALFEMDGQPRTGKKAQFREKILRELRTNTHADEELERPENPRGTECIVIDAMHLVHRIRLMPNEKVFGDVARRVTERWLSPHLAVDDVTSVHLVFDDAREPMPEKAHVRRERDGAVGEGALDPARIDELPHRETKIQSSTDLPKSSRRKSAWEAFLKDRDLKKKFIEFLCVEIPRVLQEVDSILAVGQEVIVSGGVPDGNAIRLYRRVEGRAATTAVVTDYHCSHPEADTSTFLHAVKHATRDLRQGEVRRVTVVSRDTDAFFIGLLAQQKMNQEHKGGVQLALLYREREGLNPPAYLDLTVACRALDRIGQANQIPRGRAVPTLVSLFLVGGCDFVSFIYRVTHVKLWDAVKKHARFVTGDAETRLFGHGTKPADFDQRCFNGFLRLVACGFRAKHASSFDKKAIETMYGDAEESAEGDAPQSSARDDGDAAGGLIVLPTLARLLAKISEDTRTSTINLEDRMPTCGAWLFHWLRAKRVWERWSQFDVAEPVLSALEERGYVRGDDNAYRFRLDTAESRRAAEKVMQVMRRGCRCLGGCRDKKCPCVKSGVQCNWRCHRNNLNVDCANQQAAQPTEQQEGGDVDEQQQQQPEGDDGDSGAQPVETSDEEDEEDASAGPRCPYCSGKIQVEPGAAYYCPACSRAVEPDRVVYEDEDGEEDADPYRGERQLIEDESDEDETAGASGDPTTVADALRRSARLAERLGGDEGGWGER